MGEGTPDWTSQAETGAPPVGAAAAGAAPVCPEAQSLPAIEPPAREHRNEMRNTLQHRSRVWLAKATETFSLFMRLIDSMAFTLLTRIWTLSQ